MRRSLSAETTPRPHQDDEKGTTRPGAHLLLTLLEQLAPLPVEVVTDPEPDGVLSSWRTYRLALETFPDEATHVLVLQDDATPCRDFAKALPSVIAAAQDFSGEDALLALWAPGGNRSTGCSLWCS